MDKYRRGKTPNLNLRYNVLTVLVYVIGFILIIQLFNLQIVNGSTYRETSNTRLTRDSTLYAARGNILDRNGSIIAGSEMTFALEMYKTKIENDLLNDTILEVIKTLESNGDGYTDTFPVSIDPFRFEFSSDERKNEWIKKYNLPENATPEDAFNFFKDKYEIKNEDIGDIRRIITVRYRISSEGYSVSKSLTISNNISRQSALIFDEQGDRYPGIDVVVSSKRYYPNGSVASHIIGYINSIKEEQYNAHKDEGYTMNDIYGQDGIEYVFEKYLKGKNGIKQIDMSVDGETVNEEVEEEAIAGANVVLTIDANLQKVAENSLKQAIEDAKKTDSGKDALARSNCCNEY